MKKELVIFIIVMFVALVVVYFLSKHHETYVSGSYDITPSITVNMDWKGSQVATFPNYPNNITNGSEKVQTQIRKLQTYQSKSDGPTDTNYVSTDMTYKPDQANMNNVNNLEGFTMMNPYVSNH